MGSIQSWGKEKEIIHLVQCFRFRRRLVSVFCLKDSIRIWKRNSFREESLVERRENIGDTKESWILGGGIRN